MNLTTTSVPSEVEKKILIAIDLKKQLEQYEKEIKDELLQAMIENNITSIKNDKYTITVASRTNYKTSTDEIPTEFAKISLDTTKVGKFVKLYGNIPNGITSSESKYITWRAK